MHTPGRAAVLVLALAGLLAPLPASQVERWYSNGLYPHLQRAITPVSNLLPVAVLDIAGAFGLATCAWYVRRVVRSQRPWRACGTLTLAIVTFAGLTYVLFLALWGLNYRRVHLEQKLAFDPARITRDAARRTAAESVRLVNGNYTGAHAEDPGSPELADAFAQAQSLLGGQAPARPGRAKRSLLTLYFRWAAIDGMTDPFFLEIIVNPDVLAVERPFVVAHEWAHLAGYADESEANFVAWLTCAHGNALARYSGWLALYAHLSDALPREERRALAMTLETGPRQDIVAIGARLRLSTPVVRGVAQGVYDSYLKANGVQRGIRSYDAVVRLVLGTEFDNAWAPRLAAARPASALLTLPGSSLAPSFGRSDVVSGPPPLTAACGRAAACGLHGTGS